MSDSLVMNAITIVDHAGTDEALCAGGGTMAFQGHTFEHEHVIEPGTEDRWATTILYCKRCGHIRELVVSASDAG